MNVALRDALIDAGVTRAELARKVDVAVKTVDRWLSSPERAPHPGTRTAVAEVLGVGPEMLWPRAVRSTIKLGTDREIVASYPYRNACPTALWASLIDGAKRRVIFAGYTNYFLWQDHPRVAARLAAKAEAGCSVRFIVGDPDSEVTRRREAVEGVPLTVGTRIRITLDQLQKMGPVPGLEARFSDDHIALSVFVFDDQMLVTPHIANLLGHESPMLHLRRLEADGLYDRFAQHVDALWEGGRPVPIVGGGS
ncbi:multiprotein-bridging factor 1 family protein [Streptomyces sp. NPDC058290]|uniref:helix-turn-helix domain-containing protein n=1 Tax=Streptomyces sp. NPDC058290 TaxID=3346426 RepID=UPI0036EE8F30